MSTREKIIDAAMDIVRSQGVGRITLDEAAKVAGVSKGGVLYHFRSKDDLIRAMIQRLIDQMDELHDHHYQSEAEGPYRWARTYLQAVFDPSGPCDDPVGGGLLVAAVNNPALLEPMQKKYAEWNQRLISDSPDPARAVLVGLAMDGLIYSQLLGLQSDGGMDREQLKTAALALLQ